VDGHRFDNLAKSLRSRRSIVGLAVGLVALAGVNRDEAAAKKCKKKCGPCKRCKKGKCKPKPGAPRCGPCRVCTRGVCRASCPPEECVDNGGEDVCLRDFNPPCETCSACNRVLGQCEPMCTEDQCIDDFCRVPCENPCGDCSVCDFGECFDLCPDAVACENNLCKTPCSPTCSTDEECIGGECFPACDPPCDAGQGCVATSQGNACVELAGNCPDGTHDACYEPDGLACSANNRSGGRCVTLPGGGAYCARGNSCAACESDLDCQSQGYGPNSRCVADCAFCGGVGCVTFAGDPN
jgi:hypothetical protein